MAIQLTCPCGKRLQVKSELAGKAVRCPGCAKVIRVPAPAVEPVPIPPPPPPPPPVLAETPSGNIPIISSQSWLYPPKHENGLLAQAGDSLWIAAAVFNSVRPQFERLQASEDPAQVLGPGAVRIPLDAIDRITIDKNRANLIFEYREQVNDKPVAKQRELLIDDTVKRDEIFAILSRRFGRAWHTRSEQLSPMSAVAGHIVLIILTLLALPILIWLVHWLQGPDLLTDIGDGRLYRIGRALTQLLQDAVRWGGFGVDIAIVIVAAFAILAWIVLMFSNLRMPPLLWHLEKTGGK